MSEDLLDEEWRDIPGFEGLYQVSNGGDVLSFKGRTPRLLAKTPNSKGYLQVSLFTGNSKSAEKYQVARAVLNAFQPHPNAKDFTVNHIDRNKNNNVLDNLEWATLGTNIVHCREDMKSKKRIAALEAALQQIARLVPDGSPAQQQALAVLNDR